MRHRQRRGRARSRQRGLRDQPAADRPAQPEAHVACAMLRNGTQFTPSLQSEKCLLTGKNSPDADGPRVPRGFVGHRGETGAIRSGVLLTAN